MKLFFCFKTTKRSSSTFSSAFKKRSEQPLPSKSFKSTSRASPAQCVSQPNGLRKREPLYKIGGCEVEVSPHVVQMRHGSVVRGVHRLADAGLLALHETQLVHRVVHPQRQQLVPRQPLPADTQTDRQTDGFKPTDSHTRRAPPHCVLPSSLGVKEEHQEELLALFRLPPLAQFEHLHGRHWDGDAVVKKPFLGHVRVNDLQQYVASIAFGLGDASRRRRQRDAFSCHSRMGNLTHARTHAHTVS